MNNCGSVKTAAFSREMRRRLSQSRREQRNPTSGRRPTGGACCLIFLLIVVAVVIYAFLEAYVFGPRRNDETQSYTRPVSSETQCIQGKQTAQKRSGALFEGNHGLNLRLLA